jgi:hypothetical protein
MVWPKCLTKVFRRNRTSTPPRMHRRQAEGLQHTGPVIIAGDRLRHFYVCRPFAVQGAVTRYARSTATAASLAVHPDGRDTVAAVAQSDRYVRARMPPGWPPDGITAAPLFAHLSPENCGSSQPLTPTRPAGLAYPNAGQRLNPAPEHRLHLVNPAPAAPAAGLSSFLHIRRLPENALVELPPPRGFQGQSKRRG